MPKTPKPSAKARKYYVDTLPKKWSDAPPICTTQDGLTPNAIYVIEASALPQMIEEAAKAGYESEVIERVHPKWADLPAETKDNCRKVIAAALTAIGLPCTPEQQNKGRGKK